MSTIFSDLHIHSLSHVWQFLSYMLPVSQNSSPDGTVNLSDTGEFWVYL
jgi:hypothetical protein